MSDLADTAARLHAFDCFIKLPCDNRIRQYYLIRLRRKFIFQQLNKSRNIAQNQFSSYSHFPRYLDAHSELANDSET